MIAKRYARLSVIPLIMLLLGLAALGAPEALHGPVIVASGSSLGLPYFSSALYLSDAVGLILIALAILEVWVLAITWEYRRRVIK
jgi:hypothetical protein